MSRNNAVSAVLEVLGTSGIQEALNAFRNALLTQQATAEAGARLLAVGESLINAYQGLGKDAKQVCTYLHLQDIGSADYWSALATQSAGADQTRAHVVQMYSRILFARNHLPGLLALLKSEAAPEPLPLREGRASLEVRLVDAGERASDPDRISRTIDGIEMIYTACVNIARKPAIDLSLQGITGNDVRDIVFEGDEEGINAAKAAIELIIDEIADMDDIESFEPDNVVANLPIFADLLTLQKLGKFTSAETTEIARSMREGCLLMLESGAILTDETPITDGKGKVIVLPVDKNTAKKSVSEISGESQAEPRVLLKKVTTVADTLESTPKAPQETPDAFYQRYLAEKERLRQSSASQAADAAEHPRSRSKELGSDE